MEYTRLLYMEDMARTEADATVEAVIELEEKTIVILDQTVFYAQAGGQPFDQGVIEGEKGTFEVEEVRFMEGTVKHSGHFTAGRFEVGDSVHLKVDPVRRVLNMRNHSGGHIIDMALRRLGIQWKPGKGYHFPEGPYVEYLGTLEEGQAEPLREALETVCMEIVKENIPTRIEFLSAQEMEAKGFEVPPGIPEGKPLRLVHYGNEFAMPCGGTHVASTKQVEKVGIRKIKQDKDRVRVAYEVA